VSERKWPAIAPSANGEWGDGRVGGACYSGFGGVAIEEFYVTLD
jgi:hypothetical protein